jgi:hypothetical protein
MRSSVLIGSPNSAAGVAAAVRDRLSSDVDVTLWSHGVSAPGTALGSLSEAADRADLAVWIVPRLSLEPTGSRIELSLFEIGYLIGRLGQERVLIVTIGAGPVSPDWGFHLLQFPNISHFWAPDRPVDVIPATASLVSSMLLHVGAREKPSLDYYSCFVSYSAKDQTFADRLYGDLHSAGVSCWLDTKDLRIGENLATQIDRALQATDRILLILSEASLASDWVSFEIHRALEIEEATQGTRLFPIRLDGSVFDWAGTREADRIRERHIADFSAWRDQSAYAKQFRRLIRDLAVTSSHEAGGRA